MPIACVYCGGAHDRPDEVRLCWARSHGDQAAPPAREEAAPTSVAAGDPQRYAGPDALGRSIVVGSDDPVPDQWSAAERMVVDASVLREPASLLARLRRAAHARERLVIELRAAFDEHPQQIDSRHLHEVGPLGELPLDELHHLVWSNSVDARPGRDPWPLATQAAALGAGAGGDADVVLADGSAVWLDGGPLLFCAPVDGVRVVHRSSLEHGSTTPFGSNDSSAALAADQLAAVTARTGVARIIAPAGSGKTRVLTERARHLVRNWGLPPAAITMVAFNRRAQVEMENRLADVPGVQVRTLNSIALAIVNGVRPFATQPRRWQTVTEPDVRRILGELVQSPRRRNVDPLAPWIEALSAVRLGLRLASEVEDAFDGDVAGLAQVIPVYEAELDRRDAVDFDGQVTRAIAMLLTEPRTRAAAQKACRVLLVDEFQDLTPAHVLLVRLLGAPAGAVFGVGDDDQTIYGYNGADPRWLIDYARLFPAAEDHPLEVNYRCPADVVEGAARMLRRNARRVPKTIRAAKADVRGMEIVTDDDPVASSVAIARRALDGGRPADDVAVLARVNSTLVPLQVALRADGIACSRVVGVEWLNRTPVRAALAWLRLATAPESRLDPADLAEAIRRPSRSMSPRVGSWVAEQRSMSALHRLVGRIDGKDAPAVEAFVADLALARATVSTGTTDDLLAEVFDDFGLAGTLASFDLNRRGTNTSAQGDDLLALRHLARLQPDPAAFPGWLHAELDRPAGAGGVTLATVHRVKGQEWPIVVVHLADKDQFPHRLAEDVEEERRLFHVALTRTSERVTVITAGRPSPFIRELTEEPGAADLAIVVPPRPATTGTSRAAPTSGREVFVSGSVVAGPGLVLVDQGNEWTVTSVGVSAATATAGNMTREFRYGRKVATAGKQRGELKAPPAEIAARSAAVFDALRTFRDRVRSGKPAFTVFGDATLEAIALALPTTLDRLARVKGVGPAKLEQYGDAILDLINDQLAATTP